MHRGEGGKKEDKKSSTEVAVLDIDDCVDAEYGNAYQYRDEPEGVGGRSPAGVKTGSGEEEKDEERPSLGVITHVAEDTHEALSDDDDLEMRIHVGLDALVEE